MAETSNNPAGRLYNLLVKVNQIPENTKNWQAWEKLFGIEIEKSNSISRKKYLVMQQVCNVLDQIYELKENILRHEDKIDTEIYLQYINNLESAVINSTDSFSSIFKNFRSKVDERILMNLRFCSDFLKRQNPERILELETIEELKNDIAEIIKDLSECNLDYDLRKYIRVNLYRINDALERYKITGNLPLETSIDITLGSMYRYKYNEKLEHLDVGRKFFAFFNKIFGYLQIDIKALPPSVSIKRNNSSNIASLSPSSSQK